MKLKIQIHKLARDALFIDAILFFVIAAQYIGFPIAAGLMIYDYLFFTYLLCVFGFLSLMGSIFYKKFMVGIVNCHLLFFNALLFFFLWIFLNGPFNILIAILMMTMFLLNLVSGVLNIIYLSSKRLQRIASGRERLFTSIDLKRKYSRAKISMLFIVAFTMASLGVGSFYNFNSVIEVKAPEDFTTTSSYWGPPSLTLQDVTAGVTPFDNDTIYLSNSTINVTAPNFRNGTLSQVTSVTVAGFGSTNYCNYSQGARTYPNGTILLSQSLPITDNVSISFKYVLNNKLLEYLNIGNSTLIMNYHSSGHPLYPNGYWYYENDFFASIERTYLFQILDYWGIKYYLNVHNGIDFPHVFNNLETIPLCHDMLDWFSYQGDQGLCNQFQGISPDFEGGTYDKLFWDNYTTSAEPLFPGSLFPGLVSDSEWFSLNSQNLTLYREAYEAWEGVYDRAESLGYSTYVVFQGDAMREVIDNDIDTTRLPTFPVTDNPTVRFGIMSYMDGADNLEGGRFRQYRDCKDQITIYGDRGRSILTGWIATGTSWYTDDELGLGRYIEDILICQAAGMNEIFHAPIYRMQAKWGDESILTVHQALNEWDKIEHKIIVPRWDYRSNYMDAIKNLNKWWQFLPIVALIAGKLLVGGSFSIFNKQSPVINKPRGRKQK